MPGPPFRGLGIHGAGHSRAAARGPDRADRRRRRVDPDRRVVVLAFGGTSILIGGFGSGVLLPRGILQDVVRFLTGSSTTGVRVGAAAACTSVGGLIELGQRAQAIPARCRDADEAHRDQPDQDARPDDRGRPLRPAARGRASSSSSSAARRRARGGRRLSCGTPQGVAVCPARAGGAAG